MNRRRFRVIDGGQMTEAEVKEFTDGVRDWMEEALWADPLGINYRQHAALQLSERIEEMLDDCATIKDAARLKQRIDYALDNIDLDDDPDGDFADHETVRKIFIDG